MLRALVAVALVAADPLVTEEVSNVTDAASLSAEEVALAASQVSNATDSSSLFAEEVASGRYDRATSYDPCDLWLFSKPYECYTPCEKECSGHRGAVEELCENWCEFRTGCESGDPVVLAALVGYLIVQGGIAAAIIFQHRNLRAAGHTPKVRAASVFIAVGGLFCGQVAALLTTCYPVDSDGKLPVRPQHPPVRAAPVGLPVRLQQPVVAQQPPAYVQPPVVAQQHPRAAPAGPPAYVQPVAHHPVILGQLPHGPQRKPAGLAGSDPRATAALAAVYARV